MRLLFVFGIALSLFACKSSSPNSGNTPPSEKTTSPESREVKPTATPQEGESLPTPAFLQKKFSEGVDFYARGNEPSWALDMDFEKEFRFSSMTGVEVLNTPAGEANQAQDANIVRYASQVEAGSLVVTIFEEACTDNMSGEKFPYKVQVEVKKGADREATRLEGCGRYVPDYRINDIYVLEKLGGEAMSGQSFAKGQPNLELHLSEGRMMGSTGCNSMNGSVTAAVGRISFGPIATTRMACPGEYEGRLLKALAAARFYEFKDLRLRLMDGGRKELAVYKKVD